MRFITKFYASRLILLLSLSGSICSGADKKVKIEGPITFQEIGDTYLSSFGAIELPKEVGAYIEAESRKMKLNLENPVFSEQEKRQKLFTLLAKGEKKESISPDLAANALRAAFKDLDVYYSQGSHSAAHLMSKINTCNTVFGEVALTYLLAHPTTDSALLQKRQALIKELVENESLFTEVETVLKKAKTGEAGLFSFWREDDPVTKKFFKQLYFSKPGFNKFNNNAVALEASVRLGNLGTIYNMSADILSYFIASYATIKMAELLAKQVRTELPLELQEQTKAPLAAAGKATLDTIKSFIDPRVYFDKYTNIPKAMADLETTLISQGNSPWTPEMKSRYLKFGYASAGVWDVLKMGYLAYRAWAIKGILESAAQVRDSLNYMQTRLIDVASIVDACATLNGLAVKNTAMGTGWLYRKNIEDLFTSADTSFTALIKQLQTATFKGKASFFSLSGKVLSAFNMMNTEKDNFSSALLALGEMDACLSMARLIKNMKNERVGYCFVEYVQETKPHLALTDFWNPFIQPAKVVTNSLELGDNGRNIILTGSNTGGKSTILKSVIINVLLAQTFGVVAASAAKITPFAYVGSYLHIMDDIAAGDSLFQAEVNRAKLLLNTMQSLKPNEFGFVVIDELFTGTAAEKGEKAAYDVAKELSNRYDNALTIIATHFPMLTQLENALPGISLNYKVDIFKDANGTLIRPFKLEKGISTSNVANEILHAALDDITTV